MMDRSATNMNYQAWRRDPEVSFDESALEMFAFCVPEI
jgi:hypothetical protein